jgi:hypothetical protein
VLIVWLMFYTIQRQAEQYGPYDITQVRSMAQTGQLAPTDLAWPQGSNTPIAVAALLQGSRGDATGGIIPYKNGPALTAYYLAVAALIPVIGFFCAIAAFFLGLKGLKKARVEPHVRGQVHAWIGVLVGGLVTLAYLVGIALLVFAFMAPRAS